MKTRDTFRSVSRMYTLQENQREYRSKTSSSDTPSTYRPNLHYMRPEVWTALSGKKLYGLKFAPLGFHYMVESEAKALKRLAKIDVSQKFVETFVDKDYYVLVYEWLESAEWKSIREIIDEHKQPLHKIYTYIVVENIRRSLISVVSAIHDKGVVHGDIKDTHVFVSEKAGGKIKLIDFGLAQLKDDKECVWKGGSRGFSPPEYWRIHERHYPLDWKSVLRIDNYALAATLYYAHTLNLYPLANPNFGQYRWTSDGFQDFVDFVQRVFDDTFLGEKRIQNKELREILRRGLAIEKDARPENTQDLLPSRLSSEKLKN